MDSILLPDGRRIKVGNLKHSGHVVLEFPNGRVFYLSPVNAVSFALEILHAIEKTSAAREFAERVEVERTRAERMLAELKT
jgi:hypothetical protein